MRYIRDIRYKATPPTLFTLYAPGGISFFPGYPLGPLLPPS